MVELDPTAVEPSFVPDRMPIDDEAFKDFVDAIGREGQQVPILVRPHPERPEKYQVAFGHRRLRAATELGIPVKANRSPLERPGAGSTVHAMKLANTCSTTSKMFCNPKRKHVGNGMLSPVEFERQQKI